VCEQYLTHFAFARHTRTCLQKKEKVLHPRQENHLPSSPTFPPYHEETSRQKYNLPLPAFQPTPDCTPSSA
ncbi:MAG: hypothetical protein ACFN1B_08255, partial [Prevotella denticola]